MQFLLVMQTNDLLKPFVIAESRLPWQQPFCGDYKQFLAFYILVWSWQARKKKATIVAEAAQDLECLQLPIGAAARQRKVQVALVVAAGLAVGQHQVGLGVSRASSM